MIRNVQYVQLDIVDLEKCSFDYNNQINLMISLHFVHCSGITSLLQRTTFKEQIETNPKYELKISILRKSLDTQGRLYHEATERCNSWIDAAEKTKISDNNLQHKLNASHSKPESLVL